MATLVERVDIESDIRPVDTKSFRKYFDDFPFDFPNQHIVGENRVMSQDPVNSRVVLQNALLIRRHFDK